MSVLHLRESQDMISKGTHRPHGYLPWAGIEGGGLGLASQKSKGRVHRREPFCAPLTKSCPQYGHIY